MVHLETVEGNKDGQKATVSSHFECSQAVSFFESEDVLTWFYCKAFIEINIDFSS